MLALLARIFVQRHRFWIVLRSLGGAIGAYLPPAPDDRHGRPAPEDRARRRGGLDSAEGRAYLNDEEMATAHRQRVVSRHAQDAAPAQRTSAGGQLGFYGSYWLDSGDTVLSTGQTSLIVDPPNGRAPIRAWALAARAYSLAHEGEHYQYLSTLDRCLSRGVPGSMLPAGYNNTHRIVQTPDHDDLRRCHRFG